MRRCSVTAPLLNRYIVRRPTHSLHWHQSIMRMTQSCSWLI